MDNDRIKGKAKQVEGSVRKTVGKVTGSTSEQVKGSAKKTEGKVQEAYGKAKDSVRKASS